MEKKKKEKVTCIFYNSRTINLYYNIFMKVIKKPKMVMVIANHYIVLIMSLIIEFTQSPCYSFILIVDT